MAHQGPFDNDNNQFVISYELLQLFQWLFTFEQEALKKLLAKALRNGLKDNLITAPTNNPLAENNEELQQSIIDFFALLETLLYELINDSETQKILQRTLIPAINHVDAAACDNATLEISAAKATSMCENNPKKNLKDTLCKELLKRWKPSKKISLH